MPPAGRGGRGGARGAFNPRSGTVTIGGTELNWDLSGLEIQKGPAERFPVGSSRTSRATTSPSCDDAPECYKQRLIHVAGSSSSTSPPPTADEARIVQHFLQVRDRIHEGPFYTILNDGMKNGLKRKASEPAPTEASLFNPFTDNQTYSAKYLKVRRRLPKLDERPYGKLGDSWEARNLCS